MDVLPDAALWVCALARSIERDLIRAPKGALRTNARGIHAHALSVGCRTMDGRRHATRPWFFARAVGAAGAGAKLTSPSPKPHTNQVEPHVERHPRAVVGDLAPGFARA